MRRQGNRNLGVYAPPTGEDGIRRSTQVDLDLMSRLNNIQSGRELGITQVLIDPNEGSVQRSSQVGLDLINRINNISKDFEGMIRQGWGGNIPGASLQSPSPSPSPPSSFIPLPPGNLFSPEINAAMQTRTCSNPCITFHFSFLDDQPWDAEKQEWIVPPTFGRLVTLCWGSVPGETGPSDEEFGWIYPPDGNLGADFLDPDGYHRAEIVPESFFTVDSATRSRCFSPPPLPSPSPSLGGNAAPPPPPGKNMCGCDCNTIASIIAEHMAEKQRLLDAIREHIDSRAIEQLQHINKMLQDIDMDLDLQPVIDEIKRVEKNLWNGINGV